METLAATSAAGVLLDLSGVRSCCWPSPAWRSKLFNRYVVYYGAQSVVLSFAAATAAVAFHSAELWILAVLTLADQGHRDPAGGPPAAGDAGWRSSATRRCPPACPPR